MSELAEAPPHSEPGDFTSSRLIWTGQRLAVAKACGQGYTRVNLFILRFCIRR
jgi:hypothetical protein